MNKGPWTSIDEIRAANKRIGSFWFSRATMRFFKSIVYPTVYNGRYFVTSEEPPSGKRLFSVRVVDNRGAVKTANDRFETQANAVHWAKYPATTL